MPFSEETITETVLLNLQARFGGLMTIIPLNKIEEGKIGADWEWCFLDRAERKCFRILVQAKVLDTEDRKYQHLDRAIGNTSVLQIDRLLSSSIKRNVPAYYALYNHLDNPARLASLHKCRFCRLDHKLWGCCIAPASAVKANLPDKSFDAIGEISRPWSCFVCGPNSRTQQQGQAADSKLSLPDRIARNARNLDVDARIKFPDSLPVVHFDVSREQPSYLQLARNLPASGSERITAVRRISLENPELDGIVLVEADADRALARR